MTRATGLSVEALIVVFVIDGGRITPTRDTTDASKTAEDGLPLHSFNTPLQDKAFKLLGLNPACTQ